jgi:dTDP-4-amino-4,6-dideoxygalactose transaminase
LSTYPVSRIEERTNAGREVLAALPARTVLGEKAAVHSFWVFPIVTGAREELMLRLWDSGFDAASGATSLCSIEPPSDRPAMRAQAAEAALGRVLYLPVYAAIPPAERQRMAEVVRACLQG